MQTMLAVQVQPGARTTRVVGAYGEGIKVQVAVAPEKGAANRALCRFLAETFGLPAAAVTVAAGDTGRRKRVKIEGLDRTALAAKLAACGVQWP
ncbi:MAG TPA: DUF167 domain-containing protein [bacterium]|nr:DUF167 domain-containing protein [bacterium]